MSSRVRRCGGCGGALSEAADDRGTITCSFCGSLSRRDNIPQVRVRDAAVYPWR